MDRPRRAAVPAAVVATALALVSGCTATNAQLTSTAEVTYNPSDGTNVTVGAVRVRNLMVVSNGGRAPGALVARLVNDTDSARTVTMTGGGASKLDQTFDVPPRSTLAIGPDEETAVLLDPVGAQPGELLTVQFSAPGGTSASTVVPVLSGALPEYAALVPTPAPTTTPPSAAPPSTTPAAGRTTSGSTRTRGTPTGAPAVTTRPVASPSGGATSTRGVKLYSPGGTPTG